MISHYLPVYLFNPQPAEHANQMTRLWNEMRVKTSILKNVSSEILPPRNHQI